LANAAAFEPPDAAYAVVLASDPDLHNPDRPRLLGTAFSQADYM
jgi:hypothetical protein